MRTTLPAAPLAPLATVGAAFVLGASLTWILGTTLLALRDDASAQPVSDSVLGERVRARVADIVHDPNAIEVTVDEGVVRLAGQLPLAERDVLLSELIYLPGVRRIRNALSPAGEGA